MAQYISRFPNRWYLISTFIFLLVFVLILSVELAPSKSGLSASAQSRDIRVVFSGTSRMRRAIDLHSVVQNKTDKEIFLDAGTPGHGIDNSVIFLEKLIEKNNVKTIFLHFYERKYTTTDYHGNFHQYASLSDILFSNPDIRSYPQSIGDRVGQIFGKVDFAISELFAAAGTGNTSGRLIFDTSSPRTLRKAAFGRYLRDKEAGYPERSWDLNDKENSRNTHYIKRLVSLTSAKGIDLRLVYLPKRDDGNLSEAFVKKIEAEFGLELLSTYHLIDKALDYGDNGHLNLRGAKKITSFLLGKIQ